MKWRSAEHVFSFRVFFVKTWETHDRLLPIKFTLSLPIRSRTQAVEASAEEKRLAMWLRIAKYKHKNLGSRYYHVLPNGLEGPGQLPSHAEDICS